MKCCFRIRVVYIHRLYLTDSAAPHTNTRTTAVEPERSSERQKHSAAAGDLNPDRSACRARGRGARRSEVSSFPSRSPCYFCYVEQ